MLRRPILIALVGVIVVVALGTAGYMMIEGWPLLDSLWMVIITLTTIGYGEIRPLSPAGRLFTMALIISGLSLGTYTLGRLTAAVMEGEVGRALRRRRLEKAMNKVRDHVIVIGYGRLGRVVVEELQANGVPVVVIDREESSQLQEGLEAAGIPVIFGDAASDEVLIRAGIGRARGVAIALPHPADATYVTLSARQLNPDLPIVTRVDEPEAAFKARRAGADSVVSPHGIGGRQLAQTLLRPHSTSFLEMAMFAEHRDILLEEYFVPEDSPMANCSLAELPVGSGSGLLVVAVRKRTGELRMAPSAGEVVQGGDVIILIGPTAAVLDFGEKLRAERRRDPGQAASDAGPRRA